MNPPQWLVNWFNSPAVTQIHLRLTGANFHPWRVCMCVCVCVCACVHACVWQVQLQINTVDQVCIDQLSLSLQGRFLWELHLQPHSARLPAGNQEGESHPSSEWLCNCWHHLDDVILVIHVQCIYTPPVKSLDTPSHLMVFLYFHDYLHCNFSLKSSKLWMNTHGIM